MKKGMSLIVLVITILVMIILAGVVVVGLSDNNPIESANAAKALTELSNYSQSASLYAANKLSKGYNADGTQNDTKLVISGKTAGATEELDGTISFTVTGKKAVKNGAAVTTNPTDATQFFALTEAGYTAIGMSKTALNNAMYVINCNGILKLLVGVDATGVAATATYAPEVSANINVITL